MQTVVSTLKSEKSKGNRFRVSELVRFTQLSINYKKAVQNTAAQTPLRIQSKFLSREPRYHITFGERVKCRVPSVTRCDV